MNARERKPKSGACLGGHGASRALCGLSICAFDYFIDSVGNFGSTTEN
jgi:hypothetical protein